MFCICRNSVTGKVICRTGILLVKSRGSPVIAYHSHGGPSGCSMGHTLSITIPKKPSEPVWLLDVVAKEIRQRTAHTLDSPWGRSFDGLWLEPHMHISPGIWHIQPTQDPNSKRAEAQVKTRAYPQGPRSMPFLNSGLTWYALIKDCYPKYTKNS